MNSFSAPFGLGPRRRNSLMMSCPEVAEGPANGVQAKARGVMMSDQLLSVPGMPPSWSEGSTCHVPSVLAPLSLFSSPTGSCGPKPRTGQLGELAMGNQLPVYGACALGARSMSPAGRLSLHTLGAVLA